MRLLHAAPLAALMLYSNSSPAIAKGGTFAIYGVIDKITFEAEHSSPDTARISGVFVVPLPKSSGGYRTAQRGYLYFRIPRGMEDVVRKEWSELEKVAGTGRVVAFCQYWVPNPDDPPYPGHPGGNPHSALEVRVHIDGDSDSADVYPTPHPNGVVKSGDGRDPNLEKFAQELVKIEGR